MLLILGHLLKAIERLKCMLWTPLVNAISLESLHQSTSNFINDLVSPKEQKLLILGHLRKTRCPPSGFKNEIKFKV